MTKTRNESGVISIFSVIMFMVFISIITLGFIKIVNDEQRQAVDNDLTASAYASARSGIEEGKRILLYCQQTSDPACASVLNVNNCNAVTGINAKPIRDALGIGLDATNQGVVSDSRFEQRWTCMTIATLTDFVDATVESSTGANPGKGALIPLTSQSAFTRLTFSWHNTSKNGTFVNPTSTNRISQPEWTRNNYPAAMRVELIAHPKGSINLNNLDADTRTVVLYPTGSTAFPSPTTVIMANDQRQADPNARATALAPTQVRCVATSTYACSASIQLGGLPTNSTTHQYYLKISALYRNADINIQLFNSAGAVAQFDNVQPYVDVTGRTNDVFRRIRANVSYGSPDFLPNFAIESGQSFCKDMLVTNDNSSSNDACNP